MVEGLTDLECSKQDRTNRMQAAVKSRADAAIEALVATSKLVALDRRTAN